MRLLTSPIRNYAWGSRTAIADLQGRPVPSPEPEAEVWMGAHPSAPSIINDRDGPVGLDRAIADDPARLLGDAAGRFGVRLPYLVKVLAAAEPLSVQVHPNAAQAAAGFAAEDAAGLARDAPTRNYVDPHHKPELLVALGRFDALCGFRSPDESAQHLESLGVPALASVIAALRAGPVSDRLRRAVETLLAWPAADLPDLVSAVIRSGCATPPDHPSHDVHQLAALLGERYPGDPGVLVASLLNLVRLGPDEAVFMPPGHLHAYLRGFGVEVMAASDNVLRAGLTPKRVDVAELLRLVRFEVLADPVVKPEPMGANVLGWPTPAEEFTVVKAQSCGDGSFVRIPGGGPRVVLCVAGVARLRSGRAELAVDRGGSVFVPAADPEVELSGDAVVFQTRPGVSAAGSSTVGSSAAGLAISAGTP